MILLSLNDVIVTADLIILFGRYVLISPYERLYEHKFVLPRRVRYIRDDNEKAVRPRDFIYLPRA